MKGNLQLSGVPKAGNPLSSKLDVELTQGADESRRYRQPIFDESRHALGMNEMDATHREFVAQVAALIAADQAQFPAMFQALINHTREHFIAEGRLMRESKYRGLPEHEGEHHRVLGELQQLNRGLKRGHLPLARAYVKEGLMEWFDTHVAMMDAALVMHLKKTAPNLHEVRSC